MSELPIQNQHQYQEKNRNQYQNQRYSDNNNSYNKQPQNFKKFYNNIQNHDRQTKQYQLLPKKLEHQQTKQFQIHITNKYTITINNKLILFLMIKTHILNLNLKTILNKQIKTSSKKSIIQFQNQFQIVVQSNKNQKFYKTNPSNKTEVYNDIQELQIENTQQIYNSQSQESNKSKIHKKVNKQNQMKNKIFNNNNN